MLIRFALWLDSRNVTLADLTQELVDRWLDEGGSHHTSGFLHWAAHHGLTNDLQVPRRRPGKPQPAMSEQNRWSTVSRCLQDTTMPTDVRAAGAFLLLYGLPVTRIVELRRDQLVEHDGRPHLVIGQHRVVIPPKLARLLAELPISAAGMWRRLRRFHIDILPGRHAALVNLAAGLPPVVPSDLLGISITSAVQWARRADRDWTPYLQLRMAGSSAQPPARIPRPD